MARTYREGSNANTPGFVPEISNKPEGAADDARETGTPPLKIDQSDLNEGKQIRRGCVGGENERFSKLRRAVGLYARYPGTLLGAELENPLSLAAMLLSVQDSI